MRAVVYSKLGDSSVLEVADRDLPTPHWGQVRVRLAVAGVNPTDWKFRAGATAATLPFDEIVPGQDGAGVVDEVGNGVYDVKAGDRVWVFLAQHERPLGTAAEYTVVPAERVGPPARLHVVRRGRQPRRAGDDRAPLPHRPRGRAHPAGRRARSRAGSCWSPAGPVRSAMPRSSSRPGPARPWSPPSAATRRRPSPGRPAPTTSSTTASRTRGPRSVPSPLTGSTSSSTWRSSRTPTSSPGC